ncbi:MAG: PEP-CTERM sorting domain-containing protein [Armatimonadota bacterium]|nr:PEP-CTERM sorting domain-containing protein [bacterium]
MRKTLTQLLLALGAIALMCGSAGAFSFDDIRLWAGSGSNRAAIVIDWNDGISPESIVWGFRWDGTATGRTMLNAVKAADEGLYEAAGTYGESAIYGLGYDVDGDGFSNADPADHYRAGFTTTGYWNYWVKSDISADWKYSNYGIQGRKLSDGCMDGWSYGGSPGDPTAATAVPEPGALTGLMTGLASLGGLVLRRRK